MGEYAIRNVFEHDRPGANDRASANTHAWTNHTANADKSAFPDMDSTGGMHTWCNIGTRVQMRVMVDSGSGIHNAIIFESAPGDNYGTRADQNVGAHLDFAH